VSDAHTAARRRWVTYERLCHYLRVGRCTMVEGRPDVYMYSVVRRRCCWWNGQCDILHVAGELRKHETGALVTLPDHYYINI